MMGIWSRLVGGDFLDWLNLPTGLKCVDVGCGSVQRTFAEFEDSWTASTGAGSVQATVEALSRSEAENIKTRLRATVPADAEDRITRICQRNKGSRPQITAEADVQANALSRLLLEIVRSHTS
jgi:hypothetical protein